MNGNSDMKKEVKKLREEVSELRNMVNLLLGLIMDEDEDTARFEEQSSSGMNEIYN